RVALVFCVCDAAATAALSAVALHAALPICVDAERGARRVCRAAPEAHEHARRARAHEVQGSGVARRTPDDHGHVELVDEALEVRSEEHTSELQSREKLVCRLLLEKKKATSY